jgi:threonine dehydrogenase-like Zn-dependent dehydrogenase
VRALTFETSLKFTASRPEPAAILGDALLKVRQAGVCSTDLEICKGYMNFAGVLGHEFVADVVSAADASLVGKRVCAEINCVCAKCDLCLAGLSTHCRDRTVVGIYRHDGAFADFIRVPSINCHVLPDSVDDDMAVFVEPLAAAFQVTKQLKFDERTYVTVLGAGRLGLLVAQVLRNTGAPVRVIGRNPATLALCEKWGIRARGVNDITPRKDQDVVVDCTGSAEGFEQALAMVRPRGTVVLKSTVATGKPLNLAPVVIDEISVIGSRCGPFKDAIRALAEKSVDVLSLIRRRFKLEQGVEAMNLAAERGVLKVMLTM